MLNDKSTIQIRIPLQSIEFNQRNNSTNRNINLKLSNLIGLQYTHACTASPLSHEIHKSSVKVTNDHKVKPGQHECEPNCTKWMYITNCTWAKLNRGATWNCKHIDQTYMSTHIGRKYVKLKLLVQTNSEYKGISTRHKGKSTPHLQVNVKEDQVIDEKGCTVKMVCKPNATMKSE